VSPHLRRGIAQPQITTDAQ